MQGLPWPVWLVAVLLAIAALLAMLFGSGMLDIPAAMSGEARNAMGTGAAEMTEVAQVTAAIGATATENAAIVGATVQAGLTATAIGPPTATPTPIPTVVPEIPDTEPVFGPLTGVLRHESNGLVKSRRSGLKIEDFALSTTVDVPYGPETGTWDIGLFIRQTADDMLYRLIVNSEGVWVLQDVTPQGAVQLDGGRTLALNAAADEENSLYLVVEGDMLRFAVNGLLVVESDALNRTRPGDLSLATALSEANEVPGEATRYRNLTVWPLASEVARFAPTAEARLDLLDDVQSREPTLGPVAGNLAHNPEAGLIASQRVRGSYADFVASVVFENPYGVVTAPWDYGLFFRSTEAEEYVFVIESSGDWSLRLRTETGTTYLDGGYIAGLRRSAGQSNLLTLIADGRSGYFYVNGRYVSEFALAEVSDEGRIEVATGLLPGNEQPGGVTAYRELTVWTLP